MKVNIHTLILSLAVTYVNVEVNVHTLILALAMTYVSIVNVHTITGITGGDNC